MLGLSTAQIAQIEHDFSIAKKIAQHRENFLFDLPSDETEQLCMKFLYAYMPVSDLASYKSDIFLRAVRASLKARATLPWGKEGKIDGILFLNDVLAFRMNNEDLVDFREDFYNKLFPRVKDLSMEQAVLEVNYWCFENATYQSTDIRTSSPVNVIRNAFGRCGEESVLCVAALRSVGIPARQCYTPRWAHCDDNHAWVEVWVDGKWHFIGACEPEPLLDRGWFIAAAQRGMLIHARMFSRLIGDEKTTGHTDIMTQLNILHHYAPTKELKITVLKNNKPLKGASVRFELINFAQLYPILTSITDDNGEAAMMTGLGDLFIHVSYEGKYIFKKADKETTSIVFDMAQGITNESKTVFITMNPPVPLPVNEPEVSPELAKLHATRTQNAVALREGFEQTFIRGEKAKVFASNFNCSESHKEQIERLIVLANGNHEEISKFLCEASRASLQARVALLLALNKKDLSDSTATILRGHIEHAMQFKCDLDDELFIPYLASPRVFFEMITEYREFIDSYFSKAEKADFVKSPALVMDYINQVVLDCGDRDYSTINASPRGLLELKCGSVISKKILFVAICRTIGVPARLNPLDMNVEFYKNGEWNIINTSNDDVKRDCRLIVKSADSSFKPEYEKNITLALLKSGMYQTLGLTDIAYENGEAAYILEAGEYRVTTANRMPDGSVLSALYFVSLKAGEEKAVVVELCENTSDEAAVTKIPPLKLQNGKTAQELLPNGTTVVALIDVGKEPTEHLLNEILEQKAAFSALSGSVLLLIKNEQALENKTLTNALAETGIQTEIFCEDIAKKAFACFHIETERFPLVMALNPNRQCIYHTMGYNVGTGDMLLKYLKA